MVTTPDPKMKTEEADESQKKDIKGMVGPRNKSQVARSGVKHCSNVSASSVVYGVPWQRIVGLPPSPFLLCCLAYL